jgi:transmembrane sensor
MGRRPATDAAPLSRPVLEVAADWHVRLRFDGAGQRAEAEAALAQWLALDEQHRLAWALVQRMEQQLGQLPRGASQATLTGARQRRLQRRTVLRGLLLLAGAAGLGHGAYERTAWRSWVADHRTAPGERRRIALADGGRVDLNTATALDVRYDANLRLLRLHDGEILVQTAADTRPTSPRPFLVETPHGRIRALGTRFGVRVDGDTSRVDVYEHAVAVSTTDGSPLQLDAGEAATFTATLIAPTQAADSDQLAWMRGMLVAVDRRLDDFLRELSRYRRGRIDCDPAVAALRVTGAYRLDDIDHVLQSLTLSHPVRILHFTRLWARVAARD